VAATRQERIALGVLALLLAAGAGARAMRGTPAPAQWTTPDPAAETPAAAKALLDRSVAAEHADSAADVPLAAGERLDPNTASATDLRRLPRVSRALAERIVARRAERGPYRTLADLDSVPGVGGGTLQRIAPYLALPAAPADAARTTAGGSPALAVGSSVGGGVGGGPVDVNRASAAELEALPGVGPALAARMVEWRAKNGGFASAEDLAKVPGIGPAKLARLRPLVRVSP
jgi:competence ComEA-like helix-hairpin-helix protein